MAHVHFIGLGGTGLSAIALVMLQRGHIVSGSDRQLSPVLESLEKAGARVFLGHRPENIRAADVVVRSSAVPDENIEVAAAHQAGIPVLKRADYLVHLLDGYRTIAVAGTHGKTTTTAMLAWVLSEAGLDPSYIIGGTSNNLRTNAHAGAGADFVIEADEYDYMFLGLYPQIAVITNIEHDHPDCFPTPEAFYQAFETFSSQISPDGVLVACADNPGSSQLAARARSAGRRVLVYGLEGEGMDFKVENLHKNERGGYSFSLHGSEEVDLAQVALCVPGLHNVENALAALAVAGELGISYQQAADILSGFSGTGRRFDVRGEPGGITLVDDYAHHPTEIRATLAAARARFGQRRLWAVWQPHTFSRTRALFDEFCAAFGDADMVMVTEIFAAREVAPGDGFSGQDVAQAMALQKSMIGKPVVFAATLEQAAEKLQANLKIGDVVIVLSAGDATQISESLLQGLPQTSR